MRRFLWGAAFAFIGACGNSGPATFDGGTDGSSGDASSSFTLRVDPATDSETVTIGLQNKTVEFHAYRKDSPTAQEVDVTSQVTWTISDTLVATPSPSGVYTLQGVGGVTKVDAALTGVHGTADLTVKATGNAFLGGTDGSAVQTFSSATPDANAANAPALEYPLDAVVVPGNLPPIDFQWTQTSDNDLYRVHITTPSTLDVYLYTTTLDAVASTATWTPLMLSARDIQTTWSVDATGPTKLLRTSTPRAMTPASDTIDDSAIYVWQSSTGTFHVIDMIQETDTVLPTNAGALQQGQPCSGCHRISRDGKRFSYTNSNFDFGALAYDATAKSFQEKIAPQASYRATYATFNPLESTQIPAMITTEPDNVTQNTAGTVRLNVRDPDTGAVVPSNIASMISSLPKPNPGTATSMPDWSPDGSFVVFAAYNSDVNYVRLLGDDIVLASIVEAPVSYANGSFTFGAPKVLVAANSSDNPDTGQNNLLPAVSPDNTVVAFTRAAGWWSIKTQTSLLNLSGQIAMVRRSDSQVIELANGSNGSGTTMSSTWPQWAPTMGKKYAWLAYASERPYGHLLTKQNASCGSMVQGQGSCKQLWVMAIDLTKMASGTADPSFAPFWVPGQSIHAQYVSPQWTKAVLPGPQ
ncbi:MAG TPA: hypothetical protein VGH87_00645 [Polyangiaceae bacterium]|jgi:hypothetical protein|nr:hypothetical protein [Polyangiaceae bacterium]